MVCFEVTELPTQKIKRKGLVVSDLLANTGRKEWDVCFGRSALVKRQMVIDQLNTKIPGQSQHHFPILL